MKDNANIGDITNITELRNELLNQIKLVKQDPRRIPQALTINTSARNIMATVTAEILVAAQHGVAAEIPFMGKTSGKPLLRSTKRAALPASSNE